MDRFALSIAGGGLYLLHKVLLNGMERARRRNDEKWFWACKAMAWTVYLAGLPFIVTIFFRERKWLFGAIEIGGAPAMFCGLIAACTRKDAPKWLDSIAVFAIPFGIACSLYDLGGTPPLEKFLEVAGATGFLIGTLLLSRDNSSGYKWFVLMNIATGWLMYLDDYPWFVPQQFLSVVLSMDALRVRRSYERNSKLVTST